MRIFHALASVLNCFGKVTQMGQISDIQCGIVVVTSKNPTRSRYLCCCVTQGSLFGTRRKVKGVQTC